MRVFGKVEEKFRDLFLSERFLLGGRAGLLADVFPVPDPEAKVVAVVILLEQMIPSWGVGFSEENAMEILAIGTATGKGFFADQ